MDLEAETNPNRWLWADAYVDVVDDALRAWNQDRVPMPDFNELYLRAFDLLNYRLGR